MALIPVALVILATFSYFMFLGGGPDTDQTARGIDLMEMENLGASIINREVSGVDGVLPTETVSLNDGDSFELVAKPVAMKFGGNDVRMYGYNGQIPGPIIKVKQGSSLNVEFKNEMEFSTSVHWHGIRVENEFDGVPGLTQDPVKSGESFLYKLRFPDEGVYWYHPHLREDMQQELGLYGNVIVEPSFPEVYGNPDIEVPVILDDILVLNGDSAAFSPDYTNFALMGRFGNRLLVNGAEEYSLDVPLGDTVRFYMTNAANTRVFNVSFSGHKMMLVGGDSGRYERVEETGNVVLSPSERYIVDVTFDKPGKFDMLHITPFGSYRVGSVTVSESGPIVPSEYSAIPEMEIMPPEQFGGYVESDPDYSIEIDMEMSGMEGHMGHGGMMMGSSGPVEWEDEMPMMNLVSTNRDVRWILRDLDTGRENGEAVYSVDSGSWKKVRIFNRPDSMHPMHHPIHIHGQRFVVLGVNGVPNDNLVWKDTVLVPNGATVDLLVDFSNPGDWMVHCHIPEHMASGMMSLFSVK